MRAHPVVVSCLIADVQRKLCIGCNCAARLLERMEQQETLSAMESSGAREVLAPASVQPPES